jgi:hypothetical protein
MRLSIGYPVRLKSDCKHPNFCEGPSMAIALASDFKEFLKLLNSNSVEYLLIGEYAEPWAGWRAVDSALTKQLILQR